VLFAYSVEVDEEALTKERPSEPVHKFIVDEIIRCVDVAADFENSLGNGQKTSARRTWVSIKLVFFRPFPRAY
jgi:proline dehydrogenase